MRHNRDSKRFNRTSGHLRCMMANLANDLLNHGRIRTTTPKAKELRRFVERMITLGKSGTMAARRRAMAFLRNKKTVTRLFAEISPRYKDRPGGYTRILKLGFRPGDCAPMSIIELVEGKEAEETGTKKKTRKTAKASAKKTTTKKAATKKKTTTKKTATKKTAEKKKTTKKKAATGKSTSKKGTAEKGTSKKGASTKTSSKSKKGSS